jgi:hypothetical protein
MNGAFAGMTIGFRLLGQRVIEWRVADRNGRAYSHSTKGDTGFVVHKRQPLL